MEFKSYDKANLPVRVVDKREFRGCVTDLINSSVDPTLSPQAFLVEQVPNWTLPTHFHMQEQFQVVVHGSGTIGRHNLSKLSIHYSTKHAGYGPIKSFDDGISYFTIRSVGDSGAWYLPESIASLDKEIKKNQYHGIENSSLSNEQLKELATPDLQPLIEKKENAVAAWVLRVPPHTDHTFEELMYSQVVRFYIVTQGSLMLENQTLFVNSVVQTGVNENLLIQTREQGVEMAVVQFSIN